MKKRTKIVLATIAVAGYMGGRKITNTVNWRVFLVDEKDPDGLIEKEKEKLLSAIIESANSKEIEYRAKVTNKEERFVDSFLCSDPRCIASTSEEKLTLKKQ